MSELNTMIDAYGALIMGLSFSLGPLIGSWYMNKVHKQKRPYCKGYFWAYFQGLFTFCIFLLLVLVREVEPIVLMVAILIYIPSGIGTMLRYKWWFIVLTLSTCNPILWVINGIYIYNRWEELSGRARHQVSPNVASAA